MTATFRLSAFGDEISADLAEQLQTLTSLNVHGLDLRGAWGKNVSKMDDDDVARVKQTCAQYGVRVACLGSPVGKSPIEDPISYEIGNVTRLMEIGKMLDTRLMRIFSFYPPAAGMEEAGGAMLDQYVPESAERLAQLARLAEQEGFTLVLENEKGIIGDTPERCLALVQNVNSPALRFAWDPANFVQVGVEKPIDRGWAGLKPYLGYVHIKDALLADGKVTPAGEGDGQVRELLGNLKEMGYQGTLALEPHLKIAGHSTGFSGAEGMTIAVNALRKLMAETGCQEVE